MTVTAAVNVVLSDNLLIAAAERCSYYHRANRFLQEDFDQLRKAG